MKNILTFCLLIILFPLAVSAEAPRFIINSGHNGEINSLNYDPESNLIFSSGEDGTVKIWDSKKSKLVFQYQISHMPVRKVIPCPGKKIFAAVESDGINTITLSVWNWEDGKLYFKQQLEEVPLFLNFSPKGNFIVYGKTDWNSLVFIDAEKGSPLPYLKEGFGIVSAAFISGSEKTILTYSNSGYIQYWDLQTGTRKTRIPTFANLKQISFVSSGRYMSAFNGREILLIDLIRGTKVDSIELTGELISTIDMENDGLFFINRRGREIVYAGCTIGSSGFGEVTDVSFKNGSMSDKILAVDGNIFSTTESGDIIRKKRYTTRLETFSSNNLLQINDFAIGKDSIGITAPGKLLAIASDYFINDTSLSTPAEVSSSIYSLDPDSKFGISTAKGDNFLVWPSEADMGGVLSVFSTKDKTLQPLASLSAPLVSASYRGNRILTLNLNGDCRLLDYSSGEKLFEYSSFGLRTADFIDGGNIVAGRNSTAALPSPLLHINTKTGETVPIDDSNLLIFDLQQDPLTGKLYSLGFEERNNMLRTVLKQHTGRNYDRSETLMAFPGEDIEAAFTSDLYSSRIFTSLGYGGIKMLYWGGFTDLESTVSIPRALKLRGNILIALNQDSSFTIWNPSTGKKLMDLYIFRDLSWAAVLSNNRYYASSGAERYISIFKEKSINELYKGKYKFLSANN